ncbi:hypothetical protein C1646_757817 [Rhizophagus diaphanus]|nr:hypothetical protein C1646_757817 [Rhizophagus diaphanus] [Rhizophagus sp. MUCL 43196]
METAVGTSLKEGDSGYLDKDPGIVKAEASTKTPLKQDNITPEEVVEVIKDYRAAKKIEYVRYQALSEESEGMAENRDFVHVEQRTRSRKPGSDERLVYEL